MKTDKQPMINTQVSEEAAQWFVEFRTGKLDAPARRDFDAWMRASPEHLRAYLEIAAIWNEGHLLDREHKLDVEILTARVAAMSNVVSLEKAGAEEARSSRLSYWGTMGLRVPVSRRIGFAAAVAIALFFMAAFTVWQSLRQPVYSTGVGEQRSVQLSDGSTIELNALSKIKVKFGKTARTVQLLRGQALFRVARARNRPFVVETQDTRVRAVGTQFDVYRKKAATTVTVVEGTVAVSSLDSPIITGERTADPEDSHATTGSGAAVLLSVGEQVTVGSKAVAKPVRANIAVATAWTQRRLIFESASLDEIVGEVNRYSSRPFVVEESSAQDLHLSGVFSSTDLDFLVRFLRERPGITVNETEEEIRIIRHD